MAAKVLRYALEDEGYLVQVASTGRAASELIAGREIALVIIDVQLPDVSGIALCSEIRSRRYAGPVLLLSAEGGLDTKVQGFNAGADDFMTKPADLPELLARANNLIRRFRQTDEKDLASVQVGSAVLSLGAMTYVSEEVETQLLTPTEMRLIEYLMRRAGQIVSRDVLIHHVWGQFVGDDTNRIDVYVRRLRHKIEPNPASPRYLRTVRGAGYVFQIPTPDDSDEINGMSSISVQPPSTPDLNRMTDFSKPVDISKP
jgi:DNA-binding response OmpR family regulator